MTPELEHIVESIIFASPEGASTKEITRCVRGAVATAREKDGELAPESITRHAAVDEVRVAAAIAHLNAIYEETGRAFRLIERPAGWRIVSRAEFSPWVRELFPDKKPARLTPSALETLAIIAYRQPMTKSGIEAVRGVSVDGPLQALLDRNVVRIAGRADLPGRPLLYETTDLFLEHFGIKTVEELPNSSELRNVKLPEPEPYVPPAKGGNAAASGSGAASDAAAASDENSGSSESDNAANPGSKPRRKGRSKKNAATGDESAQPTSAGSPTGDGTPAQADDLPEAETESESETDHPSRADHSPAPPSAEWSPPEDIEDEEPESDEAAEDDDSEEDSGRER
jgi:segregation and condensation protein B